MMRHFHLLFILLCVVFINGQFPQDRSALIDFYNFLTDNTPLSWDLGAPTLCGQTGVTCDINDRVVQLTLNFLGLEGTIPTSFGNLERVVRIDLSYNNIGGSIPPQLGQLVYLLHLHLSGNDLTGQIPSQLGGAKNLETLLLNENQFSGTIPASFQYFTHLSEINLSTNSISGTIPVQISKLGNLARIDFSKNSLTGTISTFFAAIPTLVKFDLSENQLSGRIPFEFGEIPGQFPEFYVSNNLLSGFIPPGFGNGPVTFEYIYLANNNFDCPIGSYFGISGDDNFLLSSQCGVTCIDPIPCLSNERCYLGGIYYNTTACKEVRPCLATASPKFGKNPDYIFFYGDYFDVGTSFLCIFGTFGSSQADIFQSNLGGCEVPTCTNCLGRTIVLRVEGDGLFDSTCGTNFRIASGQGLLDPHFTGFNGESMEATKDPEASNQLFHIYCSPLVTVTALFYEYEDENLFMTKFWVRLGKTFFTLHLSTTPKIISNSGRSYGVSVIEEIKELGRKRIYIEGGHLEWDDNSLRVFYDYLQINFASKIYLNENPYMNVEFYIRPKKEIEGDVTGIIGRTLNRSLTKDQFKEYHQFKASVTDIVGFTCSIPFDTI